MDDVNLSEITEAAVDRLQDWLVTIGANLPNLALAVLALVVAFFVGKLTKRLAKSTFHKTGLDDTVSSFLSKLIYVGIIIGGMVLALSILDLTKTVSSILAGLGILGLALGFAFQDTAANLMSGIYITFRQPYALGDVIESHDGIMGYVQDINLRVTKVRTFDGPIVYVPNRFLFQENFTNYTEPGRRRVRLECGVSYGEDLEKVERITIEALSAAEGRLEAEPVTVHWQGFGNSSIDFIANVWVEYTQNHKTFIGVKNEAVKLLKKAFDENDIVIPFPIRTLDFGIKGGVRMKDEMHTIMQRNDGDKGA